MDKSKQNEKEQPGIAHLIYISEKEKKEDKDLRSLQSRLKKMTHIVGIKLGVSSINQGYSKTLDDIGQKMFPWQKPSEVLTI
jgi:hypothetical protein